jgi:citrate synthase
VSAGVASLWGPAHGGANEAVIDMLAQIGKKENVAEFVRKVKNKEDGVRLMGFGHRVYKNYDPRAKYFRELVQVSLKSNHLRFRAFWSRGWFATRRLPTPLG